LSAARVAAVPVLIPLADARNGAGDAGSPTDERDGVGEPGRVDLGGGGGGRRSIALVTSRTAER